MASPPARWLPYAAARRRERTILPPAQRARTVGHTIFESSKFLFGRLYAQPDHFNREYGDIPIFRLRSRRSPRMLSAE
jgi:hypothetical protein